MNLSGAVGFKSFTDVGFRENTVAHLYASLNGKPDNKVADFKAQVDWGDTKGSSKGDLVYIGSTGTRAEYLVKGSHVYDTTSTGWATTITVTGPTGTKVTGKGARISAAMMPSGLPGTMPSLPSSVTAPANVQLQLGEVGTISSFAGVGFERNAVANLYVSLNGKPDTNLSHVHAQINWGDSSSWTEAELVYTGTSGSNAQYLVKGSHIYSTQSSGTPLVVYATGADGTSFSSAERPAQVLPTPSGIPGEPPPSSITGSPTNVQLQLGQVAGIRTTVGANLQNVPVANLYVSLNGKPDTSINNVHAQINWGDGAAWTSATLAYIGSSGNVAQYQIKSSHQYLSASTRMPILVYATGKDGTSFSAQEGFAVVDAATFAALGDPASAELTQNQSGEVRIPLSGGKPPYSNLQVTGLPDGLSALLSGNEIDISGTPTQFGVFPIGVTLNDSSGTPLSKTYSLSVLPELNAKIINWLPTVLHSRVGGGECTHLVAEALRICGGVFIDRDHLKDQDPLNDPNYNWGTLIATLKYNGNNLVSTPDSLSKVLPGDIVQYVTGTTKHMGIVAEVGPTGLPTKLFEQHIGDDRRVFLMTRDLTKYDGGDMIRILRPVPRPAVVPHGYLEFSVVNNSSQQLKFRVQTSDGQAKTDLALDVANTKNSYNAAFVPAQPGNFTWVLEAVSADGKIVLSTPITISNETGYEIFDDGNGLAIRSLP